jgi:hypothetical protein
MRSLTTDATQTEFSLQAPNGIQLWGQLDVSLVRQGKHVRNLLALCRLLVDYCKANPRDKPSIEHAIQMTAVQLTGAR